MYKSALSPNYYKVSGMASGVEAVTLGTCTMSE